MKTETKTYNKHKFSGKLFVVYIACITSFVRKRRRMTKLKSFQSTSNGRNHLLKDGGIFSFSFQNFFLFPCI